MSDLAELETFYDAMPRHHAHVEEVGPFTLFIKRPDGWPFYARPRLGGDGPFDADAVRRAARPDARARRTAGDRVGARRHARACCPPYRPRARSRPGSTR